MKYKKYLKTYNWQNNLTLRKKNMIITRLT